MHSDDGSHHSGRLTYLRGLLRIKVQHPTIPLMIFKEPSFVCLFFSVPEAKTFHQLAHLKWQCKPLESTITYPHYYLHHYYWIIQSISSPPMLCWKCIPSIRAVINHNKDSCFECQDDDPFFVIPCQLIIVYRHDVTGRS